MKDQQPKKSMWKPEEDMLLKRYVETYGEGKWSAISKKLGLLRDGKSCRLRWKNYLRPDIKHGSMSKDEEDLIVRMHKLLGNRWSLIAGRLPGRTDNEVKNYWNTHLSKKTVRQAKRKSVANNELNRAKRVKFEQSIDEVSPSFPVDDARDNKNYNENREEENWSTLIRDQLFMELDATENLNCDFIDTSSFTDSLNHNTLLIYGVDEDCNDQALESLPWDHWSYVNLFDTFGSEFYSDNV